MYICSIWVIRNYQYGTNCILGFLNVTVDNNCISVGREHKDTNVALDNDWLKIYI